MGGKAGVCLRDEEVEDLQFRGPVTKKNCSDGAGRLMAWGSAEMQGWRESMEDAHLVLPSLREAVLSENCKLEVDAGWENIGLFGVMDGHGGFQVAKFCERHLPEAIAARSSTDPAVAMAKSFVEMDELLQEPEGLKELRRLSALAKSARARRQTAEGMGCTVVLSCITPNALIVANAGDSRAVLCRNGQAVDLSKDHKPELPCERSRIESAGGWIEGGSVLRVNGDLSLSRAVGDLEYKLNPQLPPERQIAACLRQLRSCDSNDTQQAYDCTNGDLRALNSLVQGSIQCLENHLLSSSSRGANTTCFGPAPFLPNSMNEHRQIGFSDCSGFCFCFSAFPPFASPRLCFGFTLLRFSFSACRLRFSFCTYSCEDDDDYYCY
ncbi:unnamed protein product [Symbiodinium sp. CCMP2592]|nr:unnamed protein product [Symbiodinium sp. CCMP2592]